MRTLLFFFAVLFGVFGMSMQANAQSKSKDHSKNGVYAELLGNGLLYSLNYDRRFTDHISGRAGFMIVSGESTDPNRDDRATLALMPVMANYLVGEGSHRLELGAGPLFLVGSAELEGQETESVAGIGGLTTTFGYRYQPVGGGFLFRIGLTPFYSGRPQLWGGLSLGYAF